MSFYSIADSKSGSTRRTAQGERSFDTPDLGAAEYPILLSGCSGCPRAETHNACRFIGAIPTVGQTRADLVDPDSRVSWQDMYRLAVALDLIADVFWGRIPLSTIYNAGSGGDNATQHVEYSIVEASGRTLTLYGPNPRRIEFAASSLNPDWPGEGARLAETTRAFCLPPGARVEFLFPSSLASNLSPRIVSIDCPDSEDEQVEFDVLVDSPISAATLPLDLRYPAATYRCRVLFEALRPADLGRWERPGETVWAQRVVELDRTALDALEDGLLELVDSASGHTRVLFEQHFPDLPMGIAAIGGTTPTATIASRATTAQTAPGAWSTFLDLSDEQDVPSVVLVRVTYWCEALAGDSPLIFGPAKCANCHHDPSGSWTHDGDERCLSVECDSFGSFGWGCWQPNASHFALGNETSSIGSIASPAPADAQNGGRWGRFWVNCDWALQQLVSGVSAVGNFNLSRPANGGPSIGEFLGYRIQSAPETLAPCFSPWRAPIFGRLDDGVISHGAFILEGEWDSSGAPTSGLLSEIVAGWETKTHAGHALADGLEQYPESSASAVSLSTLGATGSACSLRLGQSDVSEHHFAAVSLASIPSDSDLAEVVSATLEQLP